MSEPNGTATRLPAVDTPRSGEVATRTALPGRWIDMLRDGDTHNRYGAPHAAVMAFAIAAVRHGWTFPDYDEALSDPDNRLGDHYRKKDDGRRRNAAAAHRKRRTEWAKAQHEAVNNPQILDRTEARQQLGLIRSNAATYRWPGRGDRIRRNLKVLRVLIDQGERHGTTTPALSVRTICERTSYKSWRTCSSALADLVELGWLTADRRDCDRDQPTVYRLTVPKGGGASAAQLSALSIRGDLVEQRLHPPDRSLTHPRDRVNDDLAMVLTVSAAIVYATLDPDIPQSVNGVVRRSGVSKRTVDKWLRELTKLGLARQCPRGLLQGDTDPGLVAAEHGVIDQLLDRQHRHALQREGFHQFVRSHGRAGT